jgi:hypothetical protein
MVKLDCPKCREPLAFADERRGDDVRCPNCRALLRLPARRPAAATPISFAPPSNSAKTAAPKPPPPNDVVTDVDVVSRPRPARRKRRRARADESFEAPEWLLPLGLFAAAALTNVLLALRGGDGGKGLLVFSLIDLAVTVPVTIGGMFVAAAAMGINFGGIFTAALKVAAIVAAVQQDAGRSRKRFHQENYHAASSPRVRGADGKGVGQPCRERRTAVRRVTTTSATTSKSATPPRTCSVAVPKRP